MQQVDHLRDKVTSLTSQVHRLQESLDLANVRVRGLEDDKASLDNRLHDTEARLSSCEAVKENLRRDKVIVSIIGYYLNWFYPNQSPIEFIFFA